MLSTEQAAASAAGGPPAMFLPIIAATQKWPGFVEVN